MEGSDLTLIHNPTAVHQSWKGHFTRLDNPQVLVNRGTFLEIYNWKDEDLTFDFKLDLETYFHSCIPLNRPGLRAYDFVLVLEVKNVSVLQWNGQSFVEKATTVPMHKTANEEYPRRLDSIKNSSVLWIPENKPESALVVLQVVHGWILLLRVDFQPNNNCVLTGEEISLQSLGPVPGNSVDQTGSNASRVKGKLFWNHFVLVGVETVFYEPNLLLVLLMKDLAVNSPVAVVHCDLQVETLCIRFHYICPILWTDSDALIHREYTCFPETTKRKYWIINRSGMMESMAGYPFNLEKGPREENRVMDSCPVCSEWVSSELLIVGTTTGSKHSSVFSSGNFPVLVEFYLVEKQDLARLVSVEISGFCTSPTMLTLLQSVEEGRRGVLFAAGNLDRSVFLLTEQGVFSSAVEAWRTLTGRIAFDSLAPIRHMEVIRDPAGSAEEKLFVCSGKYPFGNLKRCDFSYTVTSVTSAPTRLQYGVTLIPCKEHSNDEFDSFLCFSYEAAEWSQVLSVKEEPFSMIELSGFDPTSQTLLFTPINPTGLLQVTSRETRWLHGDSGIVQSWASQDKISKASCQGNHLAISTTRTIHIIQLEEGKFILVNSKELSHPISLLEFLTDDDFFLAVGEWIVNTIQLFDGSDLTLLMVLDLAEHQPRSILLLGSETVDFHFLVGTNTGSIISLEGPITKGQTFIPSKTKISQIGTTEVVLKETLGQERVLASCDQLAVVEGMDCLTVRRLFLGKGNCHSSVFTRLNSLGEAIVWVTNEGELRFGVFQPSLQLHWTTLELSLS